MLEPIVTLSELKLGEKGVVADIRGKSADRRRMLDLGIVENTVIEALQKSPSGDPTAYQIRGAVIALRDYEARRISVSRS